MNNTYLPCSGQSDCWSQRISLFRSIKWVRWRSWKISTCPFHVHQTLLIRENTYIPCSGQSDCVRWRSWNNTHLPCSNQSDCVRWRSWNNTHLPCSNQSDCVRWRSRIIPTCPVQVNQTLLIMKNTHLPCSNQSDCVRWRSRIIPTCPVQVNQTLLIMKNTHLPCSGQSDSADHEKYPPALFKSIRLCEMKITNNTHLPCSGQSDSADHGGHAGICHCLVPAESESVGMIASPRKLAGPRLRSHGRSWPGHQQPEVVFAEWSGSQPVWKWNTCHPYSWSGPDQQLVALPLLASCSVTVSGHNIHQGWSKRLAVLWVLCQGYNQL